MRDFYVNLKSTDNLEHFPENNAVSFTVNFPFDICSDGSSWKCALVDISHPPVKTKNTMITLYCDDVDPTIIDENFSCILRRFPNRRFDGVAYSSPQYIKPKSERISQMSFTLRGDNNSELEIEEGTTYITLHFVIAE